ncbi:DUF2877 domain-containing protein [Thaumasiovibrio sp. DFM-14]|uniref:oxamate carbamoyltransferase subunit AllH family protein n=1 Tax=Thaumasiovibrio sp. DFM-14 TaxID=3384792 RepID=UPI0039A2E433
MIYEATAYSKTAPKSVGPLRFAGGGSKAINFLTNDGGVLTLHHPRGGIGPSGWSLTGQAFRQLQKRVNQGELISLDDQGINAGMLRINRGKQEVLLKGLLAKGLWADWLQLFLSKQHRNTGLYGSLADIVTQPCHSQFDEWFENLNLWRKGLSPEWTHLIGAGPGLTPSHDDMLVGIAFGAWCTEHTRNMASALIPVDTPFHQLTTAVSASYLSQSVFGCFSQSLLNLNADNYAQFERSAADFLNHGHYSGADTLLGLWLFHKYIATS